MTAFCSEHGGGGVLENVFPSLAADGVARWLRNGAGSPVLGEEPPPLLDERAGEGLLRTGMGKTR